MSMSNEKSVSRRGFLQGAGLTAAAVAAAGLVAGTASQALAAEEAPTYDVAETMDVDIVVVGSGSAGVAATVQAAELGATVLLL